MSVLVIDPIPERVAIGLVVAIGVTVSLMAQECNTNAGALTRHYHA